MMRRVEHSTSIEGSLKVPGDKSASHRALMLSALSAGESTIEGLSPGLDVAATGDIIEQLGASRRVALNRVVVEGPPDGLRASNRPLQCGNSGTTIRLLSGIVSALEGTHRRGDLRSNERSLVSRLARRETLPHAQNGVQTTSANRAQRARHQLIVHVKKGPTLRVANEHRGHPEPAQHRHAHLTGERATLVVVDVLGGDTNERTLRFDH